MRDRQVSEDLHEQREGEARRRRRNGSLGLRPARVCQLPEARAPVRPLRPRPGQKGGARREDEQRDARRMQDVRGEDLGRAPPPAARIPGRRVELRIIGHTPELDRRVKDDDNPEDREPSSRPGPCERRMKTPPQRDQPVGDRSEHQAVDHGRREDAHGDPADLAAEVSLDQRLDLLGLRPELLRVLGRRARGPDREPRDVRSPEHRRPDERPQGLPEGHADRPPERHAARDAARHASSEEAAQGLGVDGSGRHGPTIVAQASDFVSALGWGSRGSNRAERSATRRPMALASSRGGRTRAPYGGSASWQKKVRQPSGRDA